MFVTFLLVIICVVVVFLTLNVIIPTIRFTKKTHKAYYMYNVINAVLSMSSELEISDEDIINIEIEIGSKLQFFENLSEAYAKLESLVNDAFNYHKMRLGFVDYLTGDMDIFIKEKRDLTDILSEVRIYNWKHKGVTQS